MLCDENTVMGSYGYFQGVNGKFQTTSYCIYASADYYE